MEILARGRRAGHAEGMRLQVGGADESTFRSAATAALAAFGAWQRRLGVAEEEAERVCAEVDLALDWKWSYADGDLGWWRSEHVAEFLLEWCPRKLSVFGADAHSIPSSLASFVAFLADAGLLAKGSSPLGEVQQFAAALAGPFTAAMDDPSQFGMAKSLVAAARDDGVDLSDAGQAEDWMAAFNARPEDERRRIIPDPATVRSRPQLAPVALPADEEVAASRAAAPVLAMFAELAAFVDTGRRLTQKGNLNLADARALVERLGTGDVVDERIGQRTFRTRSAAELPRLRHVFAWAKKAGVVRVAHGKVMATRRGLAMASDPAGCFDRSLDALMAAGPLSSQRLPDRWGAWPDVDALLDRLCVHLLIGPYVVQRPVPIDELAGLAADAVLDAFVFPSLDDDHVVRRVTIDVTDMIDALALAGVVERSGLDDDAFEEVGRRRLGGSVSLTPAGVVAVRRLLAAAGYDPPVAGRFARSTAAELLVGTEGEDFPVFWAELLAWRRRRSPNEAVRELAAAAAGLDDPALRNLALAAMADIGGPEAEAAVRTLTSDPGVRGAALCWLVDCDYEAPEVVFIPDEPGPFVDVLAHRLIKGGPEAMVATLELAGNHEAQIAVLKPLWRSPSPATEAVLVALGDNHPTKVVAKAARRVAFQRRSCSTR